MKKIVLLQPIGNIDNRVLPRLKKDLLYELKGVIDDVKIAKRRMYVTELEYAEGRRQYNASKVLRKLVRFTEDSEAFRILGIIDEDMYSGLLNFVFGVARIPKTKASRLRGYCLISVCRLKECFYGRDDENSIFELRILKEAVHELGHTWGLGHCQHECVMKFSECLADTDQKPPTFCPPCQKGLANFINDLK